MTSYYRNRRLGLCIWSSPITKRRGKPTTPSGIPLEEVPAHGNQLRYPRQGTLSDSGPLQTLEALLRRTNAPSPGVFGSSKLGILQNNQSLESTSSTMGAGASRYRLQNLLPTRHAKREARRVVKVFGVPP